ncbi:hypothetical protein PMAYCL1PPCAC_00748, partial [Pristionchus mayeri]
RSYVLGDRTEEVMEIVRQFFEEEDEDGGFTDQDCLEYLKENHGVTIGKSVLKSIKHAAGLKCYREIEVPEITPAQTMKRYSFVHDLIQKRETFESWIWSDETIVQLGANHRFITTSNKFDKRRSQGVRKQKFPKNHLFGCNHLGRSRTDRLPGEGRNSRCSCLHRHSRGLPPSIHRLLERKKS